MQRIVAILVVSAVSADARAQSIVQTFVPTQGIHTPLQFIGDVNLDGYADWLVGDPYWDSGAGPDAGRVLIVNGKRFATSATVSTLGTIYPGSPGVNAGWSFANMGDVNNDGRSDFAIGAPRISGGGGPAKVVLVSGMTMFPIATIFSPVGDDQFGKALAGTGDVNGDGKPDLLVGAPSDDQGGVDAGRAYLVSGAALLASNPQYVLHVFDGTQPGARLGESLATWVDFDHDSKRDFVIGAPGWDFFGNDVGMVRVYSGNGYGSMWLALGDASGDQLGTSLAIGPDLDGDSSVELLASAPFNDAEGIDAGKVIAFSGADIHSGGAHTRVREFTTWYPNAHMGKSLIAVPDVNGDGADDIVAGSPDVDGLFVQDLGAVWVFSGATGAQLGWMVGTQSQRRVGESVAGGNDYDGDGFLDFLVGGEWSLPGVSSVSLFPAAADTYCTAKTNSNGCVPYIYTNGSAGVSSSAAFYLRGSQFLNNRSGHLFYGFTPVANPFQGGTKCVASPTHRTATQNSGGSAAPAIDCTGQYSYDFNALIDSLIDPALVAGAEVFCQYYSRDPVAVGGSSLSNAANFVIAP